MAKMIIDVTVLVPKRITMEVDEKFAVLDCSPGTPYDVFTEEYYSNLINKEEPFFAELKKRKEAYDALERELHDVAIRKLSQDGEIYDWDDESLEFSIDGSK